MFLSVARERGREREKGEILEGEVGEGMEREREMAKQKEGKLIWDSGNNKPMTYLMRFIEPIDVIAILSPWR